jgi:Peptide N-acetyl-beta-D-glucosaminyl asparaginase amidase A.
MTDEKYTGIFNTTLTAIFYKADVDADQGRPSDLIIPISARRSAKNEVSHFTLPAENATNTIILPRNVRRAVFSVSANGQTAGEEFWWANVLQSTVDTFNETAGPYPGYSPFREVQVLIDGQLAGVQWPFPVIFTGGVVPSLHRPIVGIHAFDLREHQIDITPFLPILCDGNPHTFTIRVAGIDDSSGSGHLTETVNDSWYVTGKIFLWLDEDTSSITTGSAPVILEDPPTIAISHKVTTSANGTNETLTYETAVWRHLRISTPLLKTQHTSSPATWIQELRYRNSGGLTAFGYDQVNDLVISGNDLALSDLPGQSDKGDQDKVYYQASYTYPLFANSTFSISSQGNLSIWAYVRQGKSYVVRGASVFATGLEAFPATRGKISLLETSKEGEGHFQQSGDGIESSGWGSSKQVFWFGIQGQYGDKEEKLYFRDVEAVNGTVVRDVRRLGGQDIQPTLTSEDNGSQVSDPTGEQVEAQRSTVFARIARPVSLKRSNWSP